MSDNTFNYASILLSRLFNNESNSDVCFVFGEQKVFAHKAILAESSDFFKKLFADDEFRKKKEIPVICSMVAFASLLKYIYTGTINLNTLQDCHLFELVAICKHFRCQGLLKKVTRKMNEVEFKIEDILNVYQFLTENGCRELREKFWKFVDANARNIVRNSIVMSTFSYELVRDIVRRDTFEAPEVDIFRALLYCYEEHPTPKWKELFKFIRLDLISRDEFKVMLRPTRLFTDEQFLSAPGHKPRSKSGYCDLYIDRDGSLDFDSLVKKYFGSNSNETPGVVDVEMDDDSNLKSQNPLKDDPVIHHLWISLEEVLHGCTKSINIKKRIFSADGKTLKNVDNVLTINVKPGWKQGTKITFSNEGDQFPGRIPADVVFIVKDKPHALFKREGVDIKHTVKLQLWEALCGGTIPVPTLSGVNGSLTLNEIITPQTVIRIKDQGLPHPRDEGRRGDLLVAFEIEYPQQLTDETKNIIVNHLR